MQADDDVYHIGEFEEQEEPSDDEYAPAPAARVSKKKRTSEPRKKASARSKKAKYERLTALPLEIVAEICRSADFATVHALSRSSKQFRAFLTSRSSKPTWDAARDNSGLPELAANDLNLLEYAELMCGTTCYSCGTKKSKPVAYYTLRVRLCKSCYEDGELIADGYTVKRERHSSILRCLPGRPAPNGRGWADVHEHYYLPQADDMDDKLESAASRGTLEESKVVAEMAALTVKVLQDATALERWAEAAEEEKEQIRQQVKDARREELERRFRLEGWGDNDFDIEEWQKHHLFKLVKPLSDRAWKTTQPILEAVLKEHKAERIAVENAEAREQRAKHLRTKYDDLRKEPTVNALPPFDDFKFLECVEPLWDPVGAVFDENSSLVDIIPALNEELAESVAELKDELFALLLATLQSTSSTSPLLDSLPDQPPYPSDVVDVILDPPSLLFRCNCGSTAYIFPALVRHS